LKENAEFLGNSAFKLNSIPFADENEMPLGLYELPRRSGDAHLYRLNHPLAEAVLARASSRELPLGNVVFEWRRQTRHRYC
jgi:adenine-specific DNA-methyltransferase